MMDDLFRNAYRAAVRLAEAGHPVDPEHLATARAWLEAHPDPAPKAEPCSERCRPGSPCTVSHYELGAWLPIATAPRDGTQVLLVVNETGAMDLAGYVEQWTERDEFVRKAKDGDVYRTVREECGYWDTAIAYCPTHWMPLPPPPSAAACSERCTPDAPCMVSPDGFCEARP